MFSGIVEETGTIVKVSKKTNLVTIDVKAKEVVKDTKAGDSIAVNGVCLTVTKRKANIVTFDIMLETMRATTLGLCEEGVRVNLERALRMNDRISGHFVTGHVDDMATVKDIVTGENYTEIQIKLPAALVKYVVPKGSVTLDGVSLTVGGVKKGQFSVYLIPFTLDVTNLGIKQKGDKINIETDILAKYIFSRAEYADSPYSLPADQLKKKTKAKK